MSIITQNPEYVRKRAEAKAAREAAKSTAKKSRPPIVRTYKTQAAYASDFADMLEMGYVALSPMSANGKINVVRTVGKVGLFGIFGILRPSKQQPRITVTYVWKGDR